MVAHFTGVPNFCGVTLKIGTYWIAEICTLLGLGFVFYAGSSIGVLSAYYHGTFLFGMHAAILVFGICQIVTSVLLGCAACLEIPKLLLPWIIFYSIQTILIFGGMVVFCIWAVVNLHHAEEAAIVFFIMTLICYMFRYFIVAVHSYYCQLLVTSTESNSGVVQLA